MRIIDRTLHRGLLLFFVVVLFSHITNAQVNYKQRTARIMIAGTSPITDWVMASEQGICSTSFEIGPHGNPMGLNSLIVTVPAESLKSGDDVMDANAYGALKTEMNKIITFYLFSSKMDDKTIKWKGKLTIAGVSRMVDMEANYILSEDHSMQIKGSKMIDMKAFGVEPPALMFGSVKVCEKITVTFDLVFVPDSAL